MTYSEFIDVLASQAESKYADFHSSLTPTKYKILGVRVPILRKLAKQYQGDFDDILSFPNEYYEVVFIKLTLISCLPYEEFIRHLDYAVSLMDNWALCDSFKAKCIKAHKNDFLPILENIFNDGREFYQRYVLVVLLSEYMDKNYLSVIEDYIKRANTVPYYVHMAVAWLVAEILVKYYEYGITIFGKSILKPNTHNKAIQKAIESYRLTENQKEYLKSLKIKNNRL